ncbi:Na+/H+ antiporter NhaA [Psychroflexus sediminis]|uniref:Na(+)/H(+) antiporter NhaA n=1 Tax=Psychroflexus sediminis TaxID=470826 RepID=A0A1G7VFT5_9FLAO|nr:Na+/H+ antiporter NhaA [Psychroflexus sediminis]SDG58692.1 sodium/proton antiporter, NhaA family [Psychroflexus sediminis]
MKKSRLDKILLLPIKHFIQKKTSVGNLLIISAVLAMLVANSPWSDLYHSFWKQYVYIGFEEVVIKKNILHWINDGLMSVFFFLVGLELKREFVHGHLSNPKDTLLPLSAALGGMLVPALIFFGINQGTEAISGWGIPMATDIAFALGIIYLLGDKVPIALKIFLTALAIIDDLGAVIVIAFFYTSDLSLSSLALGALFLIILLGANKLGIRNTIFYAIFGIGGLWLAVLLSGVHATIAGVLVAFTIPSKKRIDTRLFLRKARQLSNKIRKIFRQEEDEDEISSQIEKFSSLSKEATAPLHRLENALYPIVNFVILPVFAFANAGVTISQDALSNFFSPVALGVMLGLILGKTIGIVLFTKLVLIFKISLLPEGVTFKHIFGIGILASIGFTMSIFITELAFESDLYKTQAKIGILSASVLAGIGGYFYLKYVGKDKETQA